MSNLPIAEYSLLSDCHSAALVHRDGSVDWLCFPRFDSPSVFGRLLDASAGHWSIRPTGEAEVTRRYLPETMVLETTFRTATGTAVLVDALAVGRNERGHELGADAPSALLRRVDRRRGHRRVRGRVRTAPRVRLDLSRPRARRSRASSVAVAPTCSRCLRWSHSRTTGSLPRATFVVEAGASFGFALQHRSTSQEKPRMWSQAEIGARLDDTTRAWSTWSALHQAYDGPWHDLVHQSGRVLYALHYYPTGAICAAPTTSLPESAGGTRNWDYRYAWVRDASFTLQALWVAACPDEADQFFDYLADAAATQVRRGVDLQIMFGIGGERDLTERELPHLTGWRDSAPVRVGNGAWNQRQIDVYGELLDAVHRLPDQLDRLGPDNAALPRRPGRHRGGDAGTRRTKGSGRSAANRATSCTRS